MFVKTPQKDVVSWNSMIKAFAQGGFPEEALELFRGMEKENVKPNDVTMLGVLSACTKKLDLEFRRWVCSYIERNEISVNLTLSNAVLGIYMKCGSVEDAKRLFDKMQEKDIFSWTTMLDGYAMFGEYDEAQRVSDAMPCKDIAAWNALISAYEQSGKPKEALVVFRELQLSKDAKPDEVTLVCALSASAQLGAIDLGRCFIFALWFHVPNNLGGCEVNLSFWSSNSKLFHYISVWGLSYTIIVYSIKTRLTIFLDSSKAASKRKRKEPKKKVEISHW
jgi:pentatricopeptide repeat protein